MQVMIALDDLAANLRERLKLTLPGSAAHEPLRAVPVGKLIPAFEHKLPPKPGSVLILLYPSGDSIKIPLTKRADYVGAHSGQISLPGGKREPGEDEIENALRECEEEIGIDRHNIEVIGTLSQFFVIPSNFIVTPVVAFTSNKPNLIPDPVEVVGIIECDLSSLISEDAIHQKEIIAAGLFRMMAPHFDVEGEVVWGATAMMLNEFRLIVRELVR